MRDEGSLLDLLRRDLRPEPRSSMPLYRRLRQRIQRALDGGLLQVGEALPSERDLADALGVSRVTVRKAIGGLVEAGRLTQQQGAGTFVAPRVEQALSLLTSFSEDMRARGLVPGARLLACGTGPATPEEALALDLSPAGKVSRLHRLRTANGRPMTLEHSSVPQEILPDPSQVTDSLYELLARAGYPPCRALQRLHAQQPDDEEAALLDLPKGSTALCVERRAFLRSGRPVEFSKSLYRGDSYDLVVELRIDEDAARREQAHVQ